MPAFLKMGRMKWEGRVYRCLKNSSKSNCDALYDVLNELENAEITADEAFKRLEKVKELDYVLI